jgi:hypothetical protein
MHVDGSAPVVSFRDPRRFQVAVEDADQTIGDFEDGLIAGQPRRERLAPPKSIRLEPGEPVVEPALQIFRKVVPEDNAIPFPVLLVFGVEFNVRNRALEPKLGDCQARQLAPPEPGQDHRFVDQGSLQPERFQAIPALR